MTDEQVIEIDTLCAAVYEANRRKGFWDDRSAVNMFELVKELPAEKRDKAVSLMQEGAFAQALLLQITEIAEAFEDHRAGKVNSTKLPGFLNIEEEMADVVIRVMDFCGGYEYRLAAAIQAKLEYNAGREHLHGKKF